jgi:hypothetical protein
MYIPSYDFQLFDIPSFSELQANEFGVATHFSANTPVSFVDYSLNRLLGLTQPGNTAPYEQRQFPAVMYPYSMQDFFRGLQQRDNVTVYPSGTLPPELQGTPKQSTLPKCGPEHPWYWRYLGWCCPFIVTADNKCMMVSDDSSVGTQTPSGERATDKIASAFGSLPQGAGIFLIGVLVVILLILFVRR